jgi:thiol:disulfide interchange protein DsbD
MLAIAALACQPVLLGQSSSVLTATAPQKTVAKRNRTVDVKIAVQLRDGYHVNSNSPNDEYLIPLRLRWDDSGPLKAVEVIYPTPELRKYDFSSKPLSVFTRDFSILTWFKAADAPLGPGALVGRLRYQACDEESCLPPRTLEVRLPFEIQ